MSVVICKKNLTDLVLKKYKPTTLTQTPPVMTLEDTTVQVTLETPDIIKVVSTDPALQERMVHAGQEVIEQAVTELVTFLKYCDAEAAKDPANVKPKVYTFAKKLEVVANKAGKDADAAAKGVWLGLVRTRSEYKKFVWKSRLTIVVGAVGVGTSVATAVAAGATGAGGVIAIIAAVKAASKLVQNIRNHLQSASQVYATIRNDVVALLAQYDKVADKATNTAQEVFAAFVAQFLTLQIKSISRVETNLELFSKKLQGVEVEAHNVSGVLSKLLDQQDKLIADIKTAPPDKKKKLEDSLTKIEKVTNDTIVQIIALMEEVKAGGKSAKDFQECLTELKKGVNTTVITAAKAAFKVGAGVLDAFGGNVSTKIEHLDTALSDVGTAANVIRDVAP
jgi:uncharacterized protein Yka (UPF0111/DUF47 family)